MTDDVRPAAPQFLAHQNGDHVAVAVQDLAPGPARGFVLSDDSELTVEVLDEVPLGHKIALVDLGDGAEVIEYGVQVAVTSAPISAGRHVHTHNVRSARWQSSIVH